MLSRVIEMPRNRIHFSAVAAPLGGEAVNQSGRRRGCSTVRRMGLKQHARACTQQLDTLRTSVYALALPILTKAAGLKKHLRARGNLVNRVPLDDARYASSATAPALEIQRVPGPQTRDFMRFQMWAQNCKSKSASKPQPWEKKVAA